MAVDGGMWGKIRPVLSSLDPERVENMLGTGTPDVNYTKGWIELKYAPYWPKRNGPLRLKHFTKEQRNWLTKRINAGGLAFVLLKVGKSEWLLFDGEVAALYLGYLPKEKLYKIVKARWTKLPEAKEIVPCLMNR